MLRGTMAEVEEGEPEDIGIRIIEGRTEIRTGITIREIKGLEEGEPEGEEEATGINRANIGMNDKVKAQAVEEAGVEAVGINRANIEMREKAKALAVEEAGAETIENNRANTEMRDKAMAMVVEEAGAGAVVEEEEAITERSTKKEAV